MRIRGIWVSAALLMVLAVAGTLWAAGTALKALDSWNGKSDKDGLIQAAPAGSCITDEDAWKTLWTKWRGDEALPKVDFSKEIILVATSSGPNNVRLTALIDDKGNVQVLGMSTRMGGPGFGYAMIKVSRDGIKSVEGKALAEPATKPAEK